MDDKLLCVVNKADDPALFGGIFGHDLSGRKPNFTGFTVARNVQLKPIPTSIVAGALARRRHRR